MENKIKMSSSLQKAREYEKNETVKIPIEQKTVFSCLFTGWVGSMTRMASQYFKMKFI